MISLYSNNSNTGAGNPLTVAYSAPYGAVLVVFVDMNQADYGDIASVTANGVAMANLVNSNIGSSCGAIHVFYLGNPPVTGSGTVTVNYTGVATASRSVTSAVFLNSNNTDGTAQGSGANFNQSPYSLTTTVNNDIIVSACIVAAFSTGITQPSGYTQIVAGLDDGRSCTFACAYSPVITPAGSQSGNWTFGGGGNNYQGLSVALALAPGNFPAAPNGLFMVSD